MLRAVITAVPTASFPNCVVSTAAEVWMIFCMKHAFWLPIKLVFGNLTMLAIFFGTTFVLGLPMDTELFGLPKETVYVILLVLANIAFFLYDKFLTVLVRFYMVKLHPVLNKLFKF